MKKIDWAQISDSSNITNKRVVVCGNGIVTHNNQPLSWGKKGRTTICGSSYWSFEERILVASTVHCHSLSNTISSPGSIVFRYFLIFNQGFSYYILGVSTGPHELRLQLMRYNFLVLFCVFLYYTEVIPCTKKISDVKDPRATNDNLYTCQFNRQHVLC